MIHVYPLKIKIFDVDACIFALFGTEKKKEKKSRA